MKHDNIALKNSYHQNKIETMKGNGSEFKSIKAVCMDHKGTQQVHWTCNITGFRSARERERVSHHSSDVTVKSQHNSSRYLRYAYGSTWDLYDLYIYIWYHMIPIPHIFIYMIQLLLLSYYPNGNTMLFLLLLLLLLLLNYHYYSLHYFSKTTIIIYNNIWYYYYYCIASLYIVYLLLYWYSIYYILY